MFSERGCAYGWAVAAGGKGTGPMGEGDCLQGDYSLMPCFIFEPCDWIGFFVFVGQLYCHMFLQGKQSLLKSTVFSQWEADSWLKGQKKRLLLIRALTISDFYETRLFSKPIKNKLLYKVSKHLTVNYKTLY